MRRPCGAGRSSGGSAGRSRRSSRARSPSRRSVPDPGDRLVAGRRRGDERLDREVGVRAATREVAAQLADERLVAAGAQPERRVAVERDAAFGRDRRRSAASVARRSRSVAVTRRGASASAPSPPRRSAGRTGRCRGPRRRWRSRPPSGRTRPPRSIGSAMLDPDDRMAGRPERVGQAIRGVDRARRIDPAQASAGRRRGRRRRRPAGRAARGRPGRSRRRACPCSRRSAAPPTPRTCAISGSARNVSLSRPALRERPEREPESSRPGWPSGSGSRQAPSIAVAEARSASRSRPMRLAGTSPT